MKIWRTTLELKLTGKLLQKVRGYFNYYLAFAGNYVSFINNILKARNKRPFSRLFSFLVKQDTIMLREKGQSDDVVELFSDATTTQLAFVAPTLNRTWRMPYYGTILLNELLASMYAAKWATDTYSTNIKIVLNVDNMATMYFWRKERLNYQRLSPFFQFYLLKMRNEIVTSYKLRCNYVRSEDNPADAPSRMKQSSLDSTCAMPAVLSVLRELGVCFI